MFILVLYVGEYSMYEVLFVYLMIRNQSVSSTFLFIPGNLFVLRLNI